MRPVVFHLADKRMRTCFAAFYTRADVSRQLGCAPFAFDPEKDVFQDPGCTDPGSYWYAHENLDPYKGTHERVLVVLDEQWEASPGAVTIAVDVRRNLESAGWAADRVEVVVIAPELEAWMWTGASTVNGALRCDPNLDVRAQLGRDNLWPDGNPKPPDPKWAIKAAMHYGRAKSETLAMKHICAQADVGGCLDPAFALMRDAFRRWFPAEPHGGGGNGRRREAPPTLGEGEHA